MELKEFVKTVLAEISAGVADAKKELDGKVVINPRISNDEKDKPIIEVCFEIGLMSSKTKENTDGIGVFLGDIAIGGKHKCNKNNEEVTHIKFTIPIVFPHFDVNKQSKI